MNTITIDVSECLYYLVPIVVIWYIWYRIFKWENKGLTLVDLAYLPITLASILTYTIYLFLLDFILSNNFNFQL